MRNFIGHWGSYKCPESSVSDSVYPSDIESFREDRPNSGVMLKCVADDGEYLTLCFRSSTYRVRPGYFKKLPKPGREYGDEVTIRTKGKVIKAQITEIIWHHKRAEPYYMVSVDGKQLKRQYFEENLIE